MYKLAVIGSRTFTDEKSFFQVMSCLPKPSLVVSGGAAGADTLAEEWAGESGVETLIIRPNWDRDGKGAGFKRNVQIVEACDALLAFWDGESRGTMHSIDCGIRLQKKVHVVHTKIPEKLPVRRWNGYAINGFKDEWRWLSNMWPTSLSILVGDDTFGFRCSESAYQALKFASRPELFKKFLKLDGVSAKKLAREYTADADFHENKVRLMKRVCDAKFAQNAALQKLLVLTEGAHIEEANTWGDTFWGVCEGEGQNNLGKVLMDVRKFYRSV